MPRRLSGVLIFLLVSVLSARAQGDIVLLSVGNDTVSLREFEHYFHRSSIDDSREFLSDFIEFKAKVLYAKEQGWDTLPDFRMQRSYYRQALNGSRDCSSLTGYRPRKREWVKLWHLTKRLKQHAGKNEEQRAKAYMDSVCSVLNMNAGESVGKVFWIPKHYLLAEWIKALEGLEKGKVSQPFRSPLGWHIIGWEEVRQEEPEAQKLSESAEIVADSMLRDREMEEALLVATLAIKHRVSCTEADLESFFATHRSEYEWDFPHYRGVVLHCRNKKEAKTLKKYLKRYEIGLWKEALDKWKSASSDTFQAECGLFQIGKNKYVDKLVFKCGSYEPLADYPYTFVMGKKLKGPESYRDVLERVREDCLKSREKSWIDVVKQKYKVEINEEVLKTVNNSRNK